MEAWTCLGKAENSFFHDRSKSYPGDYRENTFKSLVTNYTKTRMPMANTTPTTTFPMNTDEKNSFSYSYKVKTNVNLIRSHSIH